MAALCSLLSAGLTEGRAQSNTFVVEASIGAAPVDLEVTPNGEVAVVRGNSASDLASNQKLSLWATDTPSASQAQIIPAGAAVGRGNLPVSSFGLPRFSDAIAVTNDRVVSIASDAAQTRTYVDILSIDYSTDPPSATALQTHQLGTGTSGPTIAGLAHDVAITPDGALAVVSHRNWIHVFRMSDGAIAAQFNIGSGANGQCDPGDARASVAVTNTRAVVAVRRGFVPSRTWVYILDLVTSDPPVPQVTLEYNVGELPGSPSSDTGPHDLAITPDGLRAVVAASKRVALFDLVSDSPLGSPLGQAQEDRDWNGVGANLWDSVEVSNLRAVILSSPPWGEPWPGYFKWRVDVYDIGGAVLAHKLYYESTYSQTPFHDPAWDVHLSEDGLYASFKTLRQDVVLLNVLDPLPTHFRRAGPSQTSPHLVGSVEYFGGNDATTILRPAGTPQKLWAAFVGEDPLTLVTKLRFYDLYKVDWAQPGFWLDVKTFQYSASDPLHPGDLDPSLNVLEVMLRTSAPALTGTNDWSRYSGITTAQVGSGIPGQGVCVLNTGGAGGVPIMADVMKLGRGKAVSISREPNFQVQSGWIHIVTVQ